MKKVSVIIPVYNVEEYIEECIESVVNQTLKEIEIIIVNDGTQDNSMKKIEKFLFDKRIIIINKENGGVSSARNCGLEIAKGEYIAFLDSDDFIDEMMLEKMYSSSEKADIVFSNIIEYNDITKEKKFRKNYFPLENKTRKGKFFFNYSDVVVWNKIYKNNFLRKFNIRFNERIIHEDIIFTFKTMFLADKVKWVNEYFYFYRINRNGSIMSSLKKDKSLKSHKEILKQIEEFETFIKEGTFEKVRIFLYKEYYKSYICYLEKKKINICEIKKFEEKLKKYYDIKFSKEEYKILKEDISKLFKTKLFYHINILDRFYWENNLFTKKTFRRILEGKIKFFLRLNK